MSASHFILMIESSSTSRSETLATQLVRLGVEPIRVADLTEAVDAVKSRQYAFAGIVLPSEVPAKLVAKAMKSMRRREPVFPALAYGKRPEPSVARTLRRAGVLLALWDGYDEGMLRFQLNRLVSGETQSSERGSRRAPTHVPVRMYVGGREKEGTLYSLSEGGCFIETPRASMDGAQLRMSFTIDDAAFDLGGQVVFTNVPGNLQRPNLPLGMGVRWDELPPNALARIAGIIRERLSALEV